jgi:hypothetical protein
MELEPILVKSTSLDTISHNHDLQMPVFRSLLLILLILLMPKLMVSISHMHHYNMHRLRKNNLMSLCHFPKPIFKVRNIAIQIY